MARIIGKEPEDQPEQRLGAIALSINDCLHTNSAAKFWSNLMDEIHEDFSGCELLELRAPGTGVLSRELLYPEEALQKDLDELMELDLRQVLRETAAEIEMLGPPAPVRIRLLANEEEILAKDLPRDCIDAEIFPFLIAWLLEWSGIPEFSWTDEKLAGDFLAEDWGRGLVYDVQFTLCEEHMSEGLLARTARIRFVRRPKA